MHADVTPRTKFAQGSTLINLDLQKNGNGTHWTLLWCDWRNGYSYYFDPIGSDNGGYPPLALREIVPLPLAYNKITYQPPKSYLCGYYSLYLALKLNKYKPSSIAEVERVIKHEFGNRADTSDIEKIISRLQDSD